MEVPTPTRAPSSNNKKTCKTTMEKPINVFNIYGGTQNNMGATIEVQNIYVGNDMKNTVGQHPRRIALSHRTGHGHLAKDGSQRMDRHPRPHHKPQGHNPAQGRTHGQPHRPKARTYTLVGALRGVVGDKRLSQQILKGVCQPI